MLQYRSMETKSNATEVVFSYIRALNSENYNAAAEYLNSEVRIIGPAGESFSKPKEFVDMLRQYRGKYEMKKTFSDGDDVCLLYDLSTQGKKVYMSSWYHASGGKIDFIRTIFDPSQFNSP
ncbi:MAG: nuclear transport factor 2 family protein [Candidatus Thermoplasmatota archaeon]|nr:nuclear transport factor 2 family protein [Candidatus Thermoplasmatota archaeon]